MADPEDESDALLLNMYACLHLMLDSYKKRQAIRAKRTEEADRAASVGRNSTRKYISMLHRGLQMRNRIVTTANFQQRRKVKLWRHLRSSDWWDNVACNFTDSQWRRSFRVSRETFRYLCAKLQPAIERKDTSLRLCVPLEKRVAVALWKLATGSDYRTVGHLFGVGLTTVCRCLHEFCQAVNRIVLPEVLPEPKAADLGEMAVAFEGRWGLLQCAGAVGSSHVPIIAPKELHRDYCNSRAEHSVLLLGAADAGGRLWSVCAGLPGGTVEADALRRSGLWELASRDGGPFSGPGRAVCGEDVGYYVLADSAYPPRSWVVTPFVGDALDERQERFNGRTGEARATAAGGAFRRLNGRWRCLTRRNECSVDVVVAMALTCCVLHNLCERDGGGGEALPGSEEPDGAETQRAASAGGDQPDGNAEDDPRGTAVRNALAQYISQKR